MERPPRVDLGPVGDGAHFIALSGDTLAAGPGPGADDAYRVAAWPCEPGGAVGFRDPEEDETEAGGEALHCLRDFYLWGLSDCSVQGCIPSSLSVPSGAALFGTGRSLVVAAGDRVVVLPRGGGSPPETWTGLRAAGFDPCNKRIAMLLPTGQAVLRDIT